MSVSRCSPAIILLAVALGAFMGCASPPADPVLIEVEPLGPPLAFEPCVTEAIELDASAWRDYVRHLRELIVVAESDHEALATVGMTMRVATIDRRQRRMEWLLEHDPARIVVDGDALEFRTFDWSEDDTAALAAADPTISELGARRDELSAQYAATPGLNLFVEWYNTRLVGSDGYRAATTDLNDREKRVERLLSRCLPIGADSAPPADEPGDDAG